MSPPSLYRPHDHPNPATSYGHDARVPRANEACPPRTPTRPRDAAGPVENADTTSGTSRACGTSRGHLFANGAVFHDHARHGVKGMRLSRSMPGRIAAFEGFPSGQWRGTVPRVQAYHGRQNRWSISPAIPTIANVALATLWAFSAFGGWASTAFCGENAVARDCTEGVGLAAAISAVPAAIAAALALGSWQAPATRRDPNRLDGLLAFAAAGWLLAEAILFVGGYLAQP